MRAENKAMGLDDEDDNEDAEAYDSESTMEPGVHYSPSLDDETVEPTEALPTQVEQTEEEQTITGGDKSSKKRKGKGKAEPAAAPRLSKVEQKALEREAALQDALGTGGASDGDVPKSIKKSKNKPKNGVIDTMAAATGTSTPAELETPIAGGIFESQSPEPGAVPEMSKKDKRRAKEAAKKAQQEAAASSAILVGHDTRFYLRTVCINFPLAVQCLSTILSIEDQAL